MILQEEKRTKASDKWTAGLDEIAVTFSSFSKKTDERMEMIASLIGHANDLDKDKRIINDEPLQMSLNTIDRKKYVEKL